MPQSSPQNHKETPQSQLPPWAEVQRKRWELHKGAGAGQTDKTQQENLNSRSPSAPPAPPAPPASHSPPASLLPSRSHHPMRSTKGPLPPEAQDLMEKMKRLSQEPGHEPNPTSSIEIVQRGKHGEMVNVGTIQVAANAVAKLLPKAPQAVVSRSPVAARFKRPSASSVTRGRR